MSALVRPARFPDDPDTVRALFVEYVESLGPDLASQGVDGELAALPGKYAPPAGVFLIVELGAPVGIGGAVRLDTQRGSEAAKALYRSLGFVGTPRYNDHPLPGAIFMALDLTGEAPAVGCAG